MTAANWAWLLKDNGAVVLMDLGTGATVMDCVRRSMQACVPRFTAENGSLAIAHSFFNAQGQVDHPDARLIAASPALKDALERAQRKLAAALQGDLAELPHLVAEAQAIQAVALEGLSQ